MKTASKNTWTYHQPIFEYEELYQDTSQPWGGHKYFAYDLVSFFNPKTIVELGVHKGTSFLSMCQAVKDNGLPTTLYAIDNWEGDKHTGYYDKPVFDFFQQLVGDYYQKVKIIIIRDQFNNALTNFKKGSIDLLHIDGLHTYKAVLEDYTNWFSKVSDNGIIMLHDISETSLDYGVYRLWNEIKNNFTHIEFTHSHGLGVIFKNKKSKPKISSVKLFQIYYQSQYLQNLKIDSIIKNNNKYKPTTLITLKEVINHVIDENQKLENEIKHNFEEIYALEAQLSQITNSKFFNLWQLFCNVKNFFYTNSNGKTYQISSKNYRKEL